MLIKELKVSNFKSFGDVEVDFGHLNVLIGANASGKSNLVQVLRFVRDIQAFGLDNAISLKGGIESVKNLKIGVEENLSIAIVICANIDSEIGTVLGPLNSPAT